MSAWAINDSSRRSRALLAEISFARLRQWQTIWLTSREWGFEPLTEYQVCTCRPMVGRTFDGGVISVQI